MFNILGLLTGLAGPLLSLGQSITDLKKAKITADSDVQRQELNASISELEARRSVLLQEAMNRFTSGLNASVRLLLALGPVVVLLKKFVWDSTIGSFAGCTGEVLKTNPSCGVFLTESLGTYEWSIIGAVISFYFIYDITAKWHKNV